MTDTNLQDAFLAHVCENKLPVTIFLVNGVKLAGNIIHYDDCCMLLSRDGHSQLVNKHATSTIMPTQPIQISKFSSDDKGD